MNFGNEIYSWSCRLQMKKGYNAVLNYVSKYCYNSVEISSRISNSINTYSRQTFADALVPASVDNERIEDEVSRRVEHFPLSHLATPSLPGDKNSKDKQRFQTGK